MTITEATSRIGQKVVYRPPHLRSDQPGEEGVITRIGASGIVFVRYGADTTSKATDASLLTAVARQSANGSR